MCARDFIDDDLVQTRGDLNQIRMGPGDVPSTRGDPAAPRTAGDLDLPLMTRHKQHLDEESAKTAQQLERLRQMQDDTERKKRELEEARRKTNDFLKGRQELLEHLTQSITTLERNELRATQMTETFKNTSEVFRSMLNEISSINEEKWSDASAREEISVALGRINEARMEYNKAMTRIDVLMGQDQQPGESHKPMLFEDASLQYGESRGFGYWLKVGLAVSLPLALVLAALFVIAIVLWQNGYH